jgi:valyl-tRNA synthetase
VYLHGLVRDEHGRKFSKSLGNSLDPIEIVDEFGTDAFRFTLLTMGTPGNDLNISLSRVEANRNFANKIWNAARFVLSNLGDEDLTPRLAELEQALTSDRLRESGYSLPDCWILSRLNQTIASVTRLLDNYEFGEAGRQAYEFLWGEYADWYIEMSKIALNSGDPQARARTAAVLVHVLDRTLRLLHPYIPYVTEEIWQNLKKAINPEAWGEALIIAAWPKPSPIDLQAEADMTLLMDAVRAIRNARAERNVEAGKKLAAMIASAEKAELFESRRAELAFLARLDPDTLYVTNQLQAEPKGALPIVTSSATIYLPLAQMIDLAAERERLSKELKDVNAQIERMTKLLGGDFANKAPANVVQKERDRLADLQVKAEKLREQIKRLG